MLLNTASYILNFRSQWLHPCDCFRPQHKLETFLTPLVRGRKYMLRNPVDSTIDTFRCHYNFTPTSDNLASAHERSHSNLYLFCGWWNEGCLYGGINGYWSVIEFSCVKRENSSLKWLESSSHYQEFTVMVSCSVYTNLRYVYGPRTGRFLK